MLMIVHLKWLQDKTYDYDYNYEKINFRHKHLNNCFNYTVMF